MTNHDNDPEYPMSLYIFNEDGTHNGKVVIPNEAQLVKAMEGVIKQAIYEGREVRITDPGDLMLFHARNGVVLWPSGLA